MTIYKERVYNPWPVYKEETIVCLVQKKNCSSRIAQQMTIYEDCIIESVDPGRMGVKPDVLVEQEQVVKMIDNNGTTVTEEVENVVSVIDNNGIKEEENIKENKLMEDSHEMMKVELNVLLEQHKQTMKTITTKMTNFHERLINLKKKTTLMMTASFTDMTEQCKQHKEDMQAISIDVTSNLNNKCRHANSNSP